jgi:hypothetical protein
LINSCLTITEENEEELEQLKLDDEELKKQNHLLKINDGSIPTITLYDNDDRADLLENDDNSSDKQRGIMNQNYDERLSTIYESPSPQPRTEGDEEDNEIYDDTYDKLIVYDIANNKPIEKVI